LGGTTHAILVEWIEMSEKKEPEISRRSYLKYAGAGVVVVAVAAAGGAYYYSTTPSAPPPQTTAVVTTAAPTVTVTQPAATTAASVPPMGNVMIAVWGYHPEIVQNSINEWQTEYNDKATMSVVAGDWEPSMETRFISGIPIDTAYGNPFHANRWYKAGWIQNLESIHTSDLTPYDISEIKSALYPGVRDSWTASDGTLLALPYFTSDRGNISANDIMLQKAGISNYPETWADLYDQIDKIKAAGVADTPFLPHWFGEYFGICWGWLFEVANQGDNKAMFDDKTFEPTFDTNTLAADVLKKWVDIYNKGLVSKAVFTMSETDYIAAFTTGRYAYSPQQTYDTIGTFNSPSICPIAGHVSLVPATKQPWGLLDEGGYVMTSNRIRPRSDQDLKRAQSFEEFFGYKNKSGVFFVAKQWALVSFLNSGYSAILQDPDVIAGYTKQMGADRVDATMKAMNSLYNVVQQPRVWKTFWYTDWQTQVQQTLPDVVRGKISVNDGITKLRDSAESLLKQFPTE
jgi:multiple sugar transport system substrate-binding protein